MCGMFMNLDMKSLQAKKVKPLVAIHSLAYRFRFWSNIPETVALHSVELCNDFLKKGDMVNAKWSLIHELYEAYTGDIPTPIKRAIPGYKEMEDDFLSKYAELCGLPTVMPEAMHIADKSIMIDEAVQYMPHKNYWLKLGKGLGLKINVLSPLESKVIMAKLWVQMELPDPKNQVKKYVKKSTTLKFRSLMLLSRLGFWAERLVWKCKD